MGIDGFIELFNQNTGTTLGKMLAVQSKVQERLLSETDDGFEYVCEERDLDYWMQGNMPVLLVVSRPENEEAYWVSIKDYFSDSDRRASRRIHFSKSNNRFDIHAYRALVQLGEDKTRGLHLGPLPIKETLISNLLPLKSFPERIWVGHTEQRDPKIVWSILNRSRPRVSGDWLLHDSSIVSFQNLTEGPWLQICDPGGSEDFDASEWAYTSDKDRSRQFVQLLNNTLRSQLYPEVQWHPALVCYMFAADSATAPIKKSYRSLRHKTQVTVVSKYVKTNKGGKKFVTLRHLSFRGQFKLFEGQWYLEISPTYVFTWNGKNQDRFHESKLSKIKRIEGNRAVLSHVLLWAQTLAQAGDLFRPTPSLRFGELLEHELPVGFNDKEWLQGDPDIRPSDSEFELFELNMDQADET